MSRTVREANIATPTARSNIKPSKREHWNTLVEGRSHLGYRRRPGERQGQWVLRVYEGGAYSRRVIGIADDYSKIEANGVTVLDYNAARDKAVDLTREGGGKSYGRITVSKAMANYIEHL